MLGPNGTGKTAVLQALARMFSVDPALRKVRPSDFHIAADESPDGAPEERRLWIEADFEFPELELDDDADMPAVPGNFAHMLMVDDDEPVRIRLRLAATLDKDGDIEETFTYVTKTDDAGQPTEESRASKQDRNAVQVHYLPARRDPSDHISYSANALLGRALRAADWSNEREAINDLTAQITAALSGNAAIEGIGESLTGIWGKLHKGQFFADPAVSFAQSEIDTLLRHLSLTFTPGHGEPLVDFSRLSDGQQSLLYISVVLAMREIGDKVLAGELDAFDIDKLRPAIFTLLAVEEPENSLSPHYLGRVVRAVSEFAKGQNAQALVATHAPSLLRRVGPETIRYLRLDGNRCTVVARVVLPQNEDAAKYVREGVQAFPELYFSRFVILGEGDSEEVVLPRLLAARGILTDDASISIVPLGGRHVNHFWRLLHALGIPHATLLDLDLARYQGGWGRIKYAARQRLKYSDVAKAGINDDDISGIPAWDSDQGLLVDDDGWIEYFEDRGVFFSSPLDLDFMMIEAFGEVYKVDDAEREEPDETTLKAVLGKQHDVVDGQYTNEQLELFDAYHRRFKLGSKPAWHVRAMAALDDAELAADMPAVMTALFDYVESALEGLPE
ncbi:AAA family ATPase [Mesorhizobium intechi]|uniref:AAA family ATPase n=1 Tax=Mesorhizobium intechi TaxID=537601 RepID=A0A8T9AL31_9HYPH|nr:AAA family ATPase [Mesorhizobium intechi]